MSNDSDSLHSCREKVSELSKQLEEGMANLFHSDNYKRFLSVMSKFHTYSISNLQLITMQFPEASLVAGFQKWKQMGRFVKKNEKAIKIFAPILVKKKISSSTMVDNVIETGEGEDDDEMRLAAFRVVSVFDVSQTDGKPLPVGPSVKVLEGQVEQYDTIFNAVCNIADVPVVVGDEHMFSSDSCRGYFNQNRIVIRAHMSQAQTIKTLVHELAHSILHKNSNSTSFVSRSKKEVEAESVSYIVCNYYGLDTSDYSFGYISGWSENEMLELRSSLKTIQQCANQIIAGIDKSIKKDNANTLIGEVAG